MIHELARFQQRFLHALYHPDDAAAGIAALSSQPGCSVYRNTVIKGCIDALRANFPTVAQLAGDEWFDAAAAIHARGTPPVSNMLLEYGADFPDFLAAFEPARELPYLSGVARLDRLWIEAHVAADGEPAEAGALARLPAEALGALVLRPHPAARWAWHPDLPVYAIWRAQRDGEALDDTLQWAGDGALLTRPDGAVRWQATAAGGCAFLDACAAGETLAGAARQALLAQPDLDLTRLLAGLIQAGALARPEPAQPT